MAYFISLHSTCYSRVDLGEDRINERNISRLEVKIEGLEHMLELSVCGDSCLKHVTAAKCFKQYIKKEQLLSAMDLRTSLIVKDQKGSLIEMQVLYSFT